MRATRVYERATSALVKSGARVEARRETGSSPSNPTSEASRSTTFSALSGSRDPFGSAPTTTSPAGAWFANLWATYRPNHLREIHYSAIHASEPVAMPDGRLYVEHQADGWRFPLLSSQWARRLGLADARRFADRRVRAVHRADDFRPETSVESAEQPLLCVPSPSSIATPGWAREPKHWQRRNRGLILRPPTVDGFATTRGDEPYRVEVWIEKLGSNQ